MWEFVDKVVYINLDKRTDRNERMKLFFEEGKIPSEKIVRFSAIECKDGAEGCMRSHIEVLKLAKQNNWGTILIFEDDVEWDNFEENYIKLETLITTKTWDVCLLGGLYVETDTISIVKRSFCTHAYMVKDYYRDILLQNYQKCLYRRCNPPRIVSFRVDKAWLTLDFYWFKLQIRDNWIGMIPSMCQQRVDYSNVTNEYVNQSRRELSEEYKTELIKLQTLLINNPLY